MSVLSDLLQSVKVMTTQPQRIELRGEGAVAVDAPDRVMLHLVLSGETDIRSREGLFRRTLAEGEYLFVPAGHPHIAGGASIQPQPLPPAEQGDRTSARTIGVGPSRCWMLVAEVEFDKTRLDAVARIMPEVKRHIPEGAPTIFRLPEMLSVQGIRQTTLMAGGKAMLHCAVEAMFVNSVRHLITTGTAELSGSSQAHTASVAAAMRLMSRHPEREWTLHSLAAACGTSRSVFASAFSNQLLTTPMAFLARVRMMRAETLLKENRHSLSEVAALCGYRSETAFSRAFSSYAGLSPGAWRRSMSKPGQES